MGGQYFLTVSGGPLIDMIVARITLIQNCYEENAAVFRGNEGSSSEHHIAEKF